MSFIIWKQKEEIDDLSAEKVAREHALKQEAKRNKKGSV